MLGNIIHMLKYQSLTSEPFWGTKNAHMMLGWVNYYVDVHLCVFWGAP